MTDPQMMVAGTTERKVGARQRGPTEEERYDRLQVRAVAQARVGWTYLDIRETGHTTPQAWVARPTVLLQRLVRPPAGRASGIAPLRPRA